MATINILINSLPKELQSIIWKLVHTEMLQMVHTEFKNIYKIGVSTIIVREGAGPGRRRRKVFAFLDVDSTFNIDARCKFYEVSKDIVSIPDIKGWTRTAFNYRNIGNIGNIGAQFMNERYENFNPKTFCIRNGNRNVSVLPSRYFYSKPINPCKYSEFKQFVNQLISVAPSTENIRGGNI